MDNEAMTNQEFRTVLEMVIRIIEGSKDKEEAIEKLKDLSIMKNN